MNSISKYFPNLTDRQREQFAALEAVYGEWNARINVVSRREMAGGEFMVRHVLHSLAIARVHRFGAGETVVDIGTGGGFPAVPLAILFPETSFTAVDSIAKKIRVVEAVVREVGLSNLTPVCGRVEAIGQRFDWVVSRAVAPAATLIGWVKPRKGYIFLKGGDLADELAATGREWREFSIAEWFDEEFFATKKVILL